MFSLLLVIKHKSEMTICLSSTKLAFFKGNISMLAFREIDAPIHLDSSQN